MIRSLASREELIAELDAKIEEQTRPFAPEIERLDAIPGVDRRVAEVLLASRSGIRHETFPERSAFIFVGRDVSGQ
jgi:hypothetical protein